MGLFALVVLAFTWCIPARLSPTRPAAANRQGTVPGAADD